MKDLAMGLRVVCVVPFRSVEAFQRECKALEVEVVEHALHGTDETRERKRRRVLSDEQRAELRAELVGGGDPAALAARYGVSETTVRRLRP